MNLTLLGLGAAALITVSSVGYAQWERASRVEAEADARTLRGQLLTNQKALTRLQEERATTVAALTDVTTALRESATNLQQARSIAHAAPRTTSCMAHPGVRALRDSLRSRVPAGGAGSRATPS